MLEKVVKCYIMPLLRLSYIYRLIHFNLAKFLRTPFLQNTSGQLLLKLDRESKLLHNNVNDTHKEKLFYWIQYAASDLFGMFTQSVKFYIFHYDVKACRCLKKVIHQIDSKNNWLFLLVTFTAKPELVFVLTFENVFS